MQLHQLKPTHKATAKKRIGRGGDSGTYSGRGQKGQKSRSNTKMQPEIRYLFKKYGKLRGYRYHAPQKGHSAALKVFHKKAAPAKPVKKPA